jgi:hypothetical protein
LNSVTEILPLMGSKEVLCIFDGFEWRWWGIDSQLLPNL